MVVGLEIECSWGFFWLVGYLLPCLFCLATVRYTFSFHSMLTKWQDKNCSVGLVNLKIEKLCDKGRRLAKLPCCVMSDFTARSLTRCFMDWSGSIPGLASAVCIQHSICASCLQLRDWLVSNLLLVLIKQFWCSVNQLSAFRVRNIQQLACRCPNLLQSLVVRCLFVTPYPKGCVSIWIVASVLLQIMISLVGVNNGNQKDFCILALKDFCRLDLKYVVDFTCKVSK